jgi:glucan phosphoethanolaminetransferase (alkaline phosphatase superfamily)
VVLRLIGKTISKEKLKMKQLKVLICVIVLLHIILEIVHGEMHEKLEINLSSLQFAYVTLVILFIPILSLIMILIKHLRFQRIGAILLVGSMLGSFIFGVIYHIIIPGSDNIFTANNDLWGLLFQFTAILLVTINVIGIGLGIGLLAEDKSASKYKLSR